MNVIVFSCITEV